MPVDAGGVESSFRWRLTALLVAIMVFGVVDLILDGAEAWGSFHGPLELAYVVLCLGTVAYLWHGWVVTRRDLRHAEASRDASRLERDEWRRRATTLLRGLGEEIDAQFARWSLTPKEREVALLVLKGYGHREAAGLLGRSERTVRQQAVCVYRKSGLAGRAELSAFFLEDLLLPSTADPGRADASGAAEPEEAGRAASRSPGIA
jgi:DNA-binding CsgD family transcriptional regulator